MEQNDLVKRAENDPRGLADADWRAGLALRIKAARQQSGLTLDDFAALGGVSKRTQTAYESASRVPDADYLRRLFGNLYIDVGLLVTGASAAKVGRATSEEETMILRYRALPKRLREVMDDVLLLATLAHNDRKHYTD